MTLVTARSVQEVAEFVQARVLGDETVQLTGIASVQSAGPGDLVFVDDEKHLRSALESRAAAVIAGDFGAGKTDSKPVLLATQPRLAFARAAQLLSSRPERNPGIHPSAFVHASARVADDVTVEERVVIGEGADIGEGTRIGAGSVIGASVIIGCNCNLYPNVTVYPGVRLGDRVIVHSGAVLGSDGFGYVRDQRTGRYEKFPQIGRLEIEDDVEIGANTTIDRGALDTTRIARGTKIDNLVHIGHNCQIGEDVVIAAQTGLSGSITIEKNVILGGQVGIGEHARIEEGVMLGGQGGVLPNKVLRGKGIAFWGTPAKPVREYLKELATLARLTRKE
ncbi:MAG TPA: UDP-3-O-(3-hydroxymyristoyl)glucosamine N-acyltransferase [Terriglobales bacterium]|nr:UDP-3-O-(3-hydroxymyristoyl)glucosamine N-acyltransferase [Terriglobales bacterium]